MSEKTRKIVGAKIRKLREVHGYTQADLAEVSGLTYQYISQVETANRNATIDSYEKICDSFGISLSELFDDIH